MPARNLFVGGTASHVGKSWTVTAICRYLRNRGLRVAPFKAQNMSNNSYPAIDGGEIGRAQVAQAYACGLEPVTDMNPILLKPHSNTGSQVVLNGRVWQDLSAGAYYEHFDFLLNRALESYWRLAAKYDFIVIEGAGSVAEVNLRRRDLVNYGFALRVGAPALLVADIDRGGVFASILGTFDLMKPEERALTRSFAVNKFRGDRSLFTEGVSFLEKKAGVPCLGVFATAEAICLEDEDAVSVPSPGQTGAQTAIIRLPHISNFDEFSHLHVDWITRPNRTLYSHVIVPGTKNTTGDLEWLRSQNLDEWIIRQHAGGAAIIGVCGGYQMLGETIIENNLEYAGLGLLRASTVLRKEKLVRRVQAVTARGDSFNAYEIHTGETAVESCDDSFAFVNGEPEGAVSGRVHGTYLHEALRSPAVLEQLRMKRVQRPASDTYDQLALWFETHADCRLFEELYL